MGATLLALACIGLIMPTVYFYLFRAGTHLSADELQNVEYLSQEIAGILAVIYVLSLVFSLWTHEHLFLGKAEERVEGEEAEERWSTATSLIVLLIATAAVAWMSHLLVGTVETAGKALGMNQVFVGVIVVAIVANAAEHSTAVLMASKNKLDLSMGIAIGSGIQIALFVAPVLLFASMFMGHAIPLDLHFTPLELMSVIFAVGVLALVVQNGESHWMVGVMLLGVYCIIALAFYHLK
jgi:Ca2+:H+ antiporter